MGFFVPIFQLVATGAEPVLTWGGGGGGGAIIKTNLVEVCKEMLYTKYERSRPSSFREEEF